MFAQLAADYQAIAADPSIVVGEIGQNLTLGTGWDRRRRRRLDRQPRRRQRRLHGQLQRGDELDRLPRPGAPATCTLTILVSDLGNNGMPLARRGAELRVRRRFGRVQRRRPQRPAGHAGRHPAGHARRHPAGHARRHPAGRHRRTHPSIRLRTRRWTPRRTIQPAGLGAPRLSRLSSPCSAGPSTACSRHSSRSPTRPRTDSRAASKALIRCQLLLRHRFPRAVGPIRGQRLLRRRRRRLPRVGRRALRGDLAGRHAGQLRHHDHRANHPATSRRHRIRRWSSRCRPNASTMAPVTSPRSPRRTRRRTRSTACGSSRQAAPPTTSKASSPRSP